MSLPVAVHDSPGGEGVKGSRGRVPLEEEGPLRSKRPKGDEVADSVMDEEMVEKGVVEDESDRNVRGSPERKTSDRAGIGRGRVVSYKDKLLRINGSGQISDSEEEDWLTRQRKEEEEEEDSEEKRIDPSDDPLCPSYRFSK